MIWWCSYFVVSVLATFLAAVIWRPREADDVMGMIFPLLFWPLCLVVGVLALIVGGIVCLARKVAP